MRKKKDKKGRSAGFSNVFKSIIGGRVLRDPKIERHYPFIFFIGFLAILLISNRYKSERIMRQIDEYQDSVKDLRSESISIAAELMDISRPSEIADKVKQNGINLIESDRPPGVIILEDEDKKH